MWLITTSRPARRGLAAYLTIIIIVTQRQVPVYCRSVAVGCAESTLTERGLLGECVRADMMSCECRGRKVAQPQLTTNKRTMLHVHVHFSVRCRRVGDIV